MKKTCVVQLKIRFCHNQQTSNYSSRKASRISDYQLVSSLATKIQAVQGQTRPSLSDNCLRLHMVFVLELDKISQFYTNNVFRDAHGRPDTCRTVYSLNSHNQAIAFLINTTICRAVGGNPFLKKRLFGSTAASLLSSVWMHRYMRKKGGLGFLPFSIIIIRSIGDTAGELTSFVHHRVVVVVNRQFIVSLYQKPLSRTNARFVKSGVETRSMFKSAWWKPMNGASYLHLWSFSTLTEVHEHFQLHIHLFSI